MGNSENDVEDYVLSKGFEAELNSDKGLHDGWGNIDRNVQDDEARANSDQMVLNKGFQAEINSDKNLHDGWGNSDKNLPDEMSSGIDGENVQAPSSFSEAPRKKISVLLQSKLFIFFPNTYYLFSFLTDKPLK